MTRLLVTITVSMALLVSLSMDDVYAKKVKKPKPMIVVNEPLDVNVIDIKQPLDVNVINGNGNGVPSLQRTIVSSCMDFSLAGHEGLTHTMMTVPAGKQLIITDLSFIGGSKVDFELLENSNLKLRIKGVKLNSGIPFSPDSAVNIYVYNTWAPGGDPAEGHIFFSGYLVDSN